MDSVIVWFDNSLPVLIAKPNQTFFFDGLPEQTVDARFEICHNRACSLVSTFSHRRGCRTLPDQLQPELNLAIGCRRTADGIERADLRKSNRSCWETAARIEIRIRVDKLSWYGEDRVIQHVEKLGAKLQLQPFGDREYLLSGEIKAHEFWSSQNAAPCITEDFGICRLRKGGKIPKFQNVARTVISLNAVHDVTVILLEVDVVHRRITARQAGDRKPGADNADSADLPTACDRI